MEQRTHTWIAIRALALLDELNLAPELVEILKSQIKFTAIGAWLPDLQDSKRGFGDIDYHVFKLKPYTLKNKTRFILEKKKLLEKLGPYRLMSDLLESDGILTKEWWKKAYKAEPKPGQHLGNQSMALSNTIKDLLLLGDSKLAKLVPDEVSFAEDLHKNARTKIEQVATYFFMLSHFIADSCMPCHCDDRVLSSYTNGLLHKQLEYYWKKKVGTYFEKKKLVNSTSDNDVILQKSKKLDSKFGFTLPQDIPDIGNYDIWEEIVIVCRASFAISCIISPIEEFPFESDKITSFNDRFKKDQYGRDLLDNITRVIMHDSVLNLAIVWLDIWDNFNKRKNAN